MKTIILAGGSGTRLWPLSRGSYPKQFLRLGGEGSLLQKTVQRQLLVCDPSDIYIITNERFRNHVCEQAKEVTDLPLENVVVEPVGRNTAPAIVLALSFMFQQKRCSPNDVVFISSADHYITPEDAFARAVKIGVDVASQGFLVTFGVEPTRAETGYGYIRKSERQGSAFSVHSFVEKPDSARAEEYVAGGEYLWNSGMFAFTYGTFFEELQRHEPSIASLSQVPYDIMYNSFSQMPNISIDYAVMERSSKVMTVPLDFFWTDVGSFDSLHEYMDKGADGNVTIGDVMVLDTTNSLVIGNGKRLISTIGLDNIVVIDTDDALLVADKEKTQGVKQLVDMMKKEERREVQCHATTAFPWGSVTLVDEGDEYMVAKVELKCGQSVALSEFVHEVGEQWEITLRIVRGELRYGNRVWPSGALIALREISHGTVSTDLSEGVVLFATACCCDSACV